MADEPKLRLSQAPFPALEWTGYSWAGELVLPAWRGFQVRMGPYGSRSSDLASDGRVRLNVEPAEGKNEQPPSSEQANALRYLIENQQAIRDAVVQSIFQRYP